eukprot:11163504-Lingulodinium_polyedra.AAC.1
MAAAAVRTGRSDADRRPSDRLIVSSGRGARCLSSRSRVRALWATTRPGSLPKAARAAASACA